MAFAKAQVAVAASEAVDNLRDDAGENLRTQRKSFADSKDAFSLIQPPPVLDDDGNPRVRQKSSRAQSQMSSNSATPAAGSNLMNLIKDQWRRMTESGCDPFVRVELRPAMSNIPIIEETDVIVGGGKYVEWTKYDNNELTFLLDSEPGRKYLNFEVFDKDIGTDPRPLGRVPIKLESVTEVDTQYYARVDIFQGKKWAGQMDIGAKLVPYGPTNDENKDDEMLEKYNNQTDFKYKLLVTVYSADDLEDVDHTVSEEENFWKFIMGVIGFVAYLCFGAMIFAFVEEKSFGMMLWFFIVSTTTVGYGDWSPVTTAGHLLNSVFIILNLFVFAVAFSVTFNYIYAQQENLLKRGGKTSGLRDFATKYFVGLSKKLDEKLQQTIVSEEKLEQMENNENNNENENNNNNDTQVGIKRSRTMSKTAEDIELKRAAAQKEQEEEQEYLDEQLKQGLYVNFALLGGLVVASCLVYGALFYDEAQAQKAKFRAIPGWPDYYIMDPIRFAIMTMTTVGYGDMYPLTTEGKIFGSFFLIVGVSFLTRIVGSVFEIIANKREQEQKKRTMERALLSANAMQEFDEDGSGDIDQYEFLKTMLIIRGEVQESTIKRIMKRFEELDEDGSGEIDFADFAGATRRETIKEQTQIAKKDTRMSRARSRSNIGIGVESDETAANTDANANTNANATGNVSGATDAAETELGAMPSENNTEKQVSNVEHPNDAVSSDTEQNDENENEVDVNASGDNTVPARTETDKEMLGIDNEQPAEDSANQYKD